MNLLKRLFFRAPKSSSAKVDPIDSWPQISELSCFVRGLIRSMKETPTEWEREPYVAFIRVYWRHFSGISISRWQDKDMLGIYPNVNVTDYTPNPAEAIALKEAFLTYLENPYQAEIEKRRVEREAALQIRIAAQRASFEKLGCPENANPTQS